MESGSFTAGEVTALVFIAIGVAFMLISSIGILRLPDVYSRMHAAGKATTVGVSSGRMCITALSAGATLFDVTGWWVR